jgi:hypothetical protein
MCVRWGLPLLFLICGNAFGWGDEGHEIVALVADHFLDPQVRDRVNAYCPLSPSSSYAAPG